MADKVRIHIEQMKQDLLFFIKQGVFSKEDARSIIKSRETHGTF